MAQFLLENPKNISSADTEQKEEKLKKEEVKAEAPGADREPETAGKEAAKEKKSEPDPLAVAQAQVEELKDKYLRAVAEFDNYRKRTLKEKAELILNGGEKTISAILPILDDMERALENGKKTEDAKVIREGMELIFNKFVKVLEAQGVKKIDTTDADFDTDIHEAVAMVPGMGDDKKGKVLDCVQTGYKLNDKVIRHAKVAVGA